MHFLGPRDALHHRDLNAVLQPLHPRAMESRIMNGTAARFVRFGAGLLGLVTLGWILTGHAKPGEQELPYQEGIPTDWSHSHVIFTKPASNEEAVKWGEEPRYWQQLYRRELARNLNFDPSNEASEQVPAAIPSASSGGLWSEDLGNNAAPGAGNYPAKYGFSLTQANCASAVNPDYVVYSTGLQGSGTQASVVAFDNIYSGCTGTVPTVYWAYNTGGQILTSPVISLDGTQVAFVQTSGGSAELVLLKWKASATETVGSPGVPTLAATGLQYRNSCPAPCMFGIFLKDGSNVGFSDTTSSLFYDFANDIGWVGGGTGWLVKLSGLFIGTPKEVTTGGFPVHLNPGNPNALTSPVYDHVSKNVFVGDAGGFFYRVASASGAVTTSNQVDFGTGLVSGPVLDQGNGFLYVFSSSDGTAACTGGTACSAVVVFTTSFGAATSGSKTAVGQSVIKGSLPNPNPLYLGGLDSAYYNSVSGTGNMYVCGNTGANPTLYRVPVAAGALGTAVAVGVLSPGGKTPACSPVTDFPNPNAGASQAELLFFSVQNQGFPCGRGLIGCLMNFVSLPWQPKTTYQQGQEILVLNTTTKTLFIQSAASTGTTGSTIPVWSAVVGVSTTDGTVKWVNQGSTTTSTALPTWLANHAYPLQKQITDGTNVEIVIVTGTSGATTPSWNTTIGGKTTDGGITWINAGPWPNVSLKVSGGTGGVIIDNASASAGASQVYFFTQGNQVCTTSGGTGGCAMQASQSTFK